MHHRASSACGCQKLAAVLAKKMLVHGSDNDVFNVRAGMRGRQIKRIRLGLALEMRQRDVIAIANSSFGGVGWNHAVASIVVYSRPEGDGWIGFGVDFGGTNDRCELLLKCIKKMPIHDRWLLDEAGSSSLYLNLDDIEPVAHKQIFRTAIPFEGMASIGRHRLARSLICSDCISL